MGEERAILSLSWQTDIDVLPPERELVRRDAYWVIHSPTNPYHWWGNFLLFDEPPGPGDGDRWDSLFATELGSQVPHRTFAWDRTDGALGAAQEEFGPRGYQLQQTVGLIANPEAIVSHPRENREVVVRALRPDGDEALWEQVTELQVAERPAEVPEAEHRAFTQARQADLRRIFRDGRGAWFVAMAGEQRRGQLAQVVGSCGVVVTGPRARYQAVDTAVAYRRQGICSRLVAEAARRIASAYPVQRLVICADASYFATGIYESLGFARAERVGAVLRVPSS